jgi:hypothetical protein
VAALAPQDQPVLSITWSEAHRFPLVSWQPLVRYCLPPDIGALDPQVREDCLLAGEHMARSRGGLIVKMIGVAIVRNLAKGTPQAEEAKQIRAQYEYLGDMDDRLSVRQRASYPTTLFLKDMMSSGELVAMQRRIEFFGLPGHPAANWKPADPTRLLSSREWLDGLIAVHEKGQERLARGDFAGAIAVLAPVEEDSRKHLGNRVKWRFVRYLVTIANAHAGLGHFDLAEKFLLEAWDIAMGFGPSSAERRDCVAALLALYQAKYTQQPEKATEAKILQWRQIQAELQQGR